MAERTWTVQDMFMGGWDDPSGFGFGEKAPGVDPAVPIPTEAASAAPDDSDVVPDSEAAAQRPGSGEEAEDPMAALLFGMANLQGFGTEQLVALAPELMRMLRLEFVPGSYTEADKFTGEGGEKILPHYRRMDYDQWLSGLDPDEAENELIKQESRSNMLRLLRGDPEAVPGMDTYLDKQREEQHAALLRRGITPGSTAYTQAMSSLETNLAPVMEQFKHAEFGRATSGAKGVPAGTNILEALAIPQTALGTGAGGSALQTLANLAQASGATEASNVAAGSSLLGSVIELFS